MLASVGLFATGCPATPTDPPATNLPGLGAVPPTSVTAAAPLPEGTVLPTSVDLTPWAVRVGNQGSVGSCVAWTFAYGYLGWESRHNLFNGNLFSPMYAYYNATHGVNSGTSPSTVVGILESKGTPPQAGYGASETGFTHVPTAAEDAAAAAYQLDNGLTTLFSGANQGTAASNAIKRALSQQKPVGIMFPVRPGFDNLGKSPSAVDNDTSGTIRGYHEVLALGYDSTGLLIQNSWGTGWGNNGYGRLSWGVVQSDVVEADVMGAPAGRPNMTVTSGNGTALGVPFSGVMNFGDGVGQWQQYYGSWVIGSPNGGTWQMTNQIHDSWIGRGGDIGSFGYPTGSISSQTGGGSSQAFAGGTLVYSPAYGVKGVQGAILTYWINNGSSSGVLGLPSGEVYPQPGGQSQQFVGGVIVTYPGGTFRVSGPIMTYWINASSGSGPLGFPTSEPSGTNANGTQHFQHGTLTVTNGVVTMTP